MKTTLLLIATTLLIWGCTREQEFEQLSADQRNAVRVMQSSYLQARVYNDSLVMGTLENRNAALLAYFDQMYHRFENDFNRCHNGFVHTTTSADHTHNSQGAMQMHSISSSMSMSGSGCNCCAKGGHSGAIHRQMEDLDRLHVPYHPK